jgi:hypothetical protein
MSFIKNNKTRVDICVNHCAYPTYESNILYKDAAGYHNECIQYGDELHLQVQHTFTQDLSIKDAYSYCVGFHTAKGECVRPTVLNTKGYYDTVKAYYMDLASRINTLAKDYDFYEYMDQVSNEDDAVNSIFESLKNGDVSPYKRFLKKNIMDETSSDDYDNKLAFVLSLELDNCNIKCADKPAQFDILKSMMSKSDGFDDSNKDLGSDLSVC